MGAMSKKKGRVLHIQLEGELIEGRVGFSLMGRAPREELQRLTKVLRRATKDPKVRGLILSLSHIELGWSKATTLARAIAEFRETGKPTAAFIESASNIEYFLASHCETLVMPPSGNLNLHGLQAEVFFVKDLLERAGIDAELESVGEYKSAGETFTRREMSPPHREEVQELLEDLSHQWVDTVAKNRSFDRARVQELLDEGPFIAEEAKEAGWIDRVGTEEQCESVLEDALGSSITPVPHGRYRTGDRWWTRLLRFRRPRVAVIFAVGVIGSGEDRRSRSPRPVIGARTLGKLLKSVRESSRIKAVVLRIDSPGGSALASELIWREVELTREKKPVVVSMGDVAASGGYYIASAADGIVAEPSSLTGSIGIIGGKAVVRRILDKLGIHRETVAVQAPSNFYSPFHAFTTDEREKLSRHLRHYYEKLFVPRVAAGRGMSNEEVDEVARGRIWTGRQGKQKGLVDELGDLDVAVELAKEKAGIPPGKKVQILTYARRARLRHLLTGVPWGEAHFGGSGLGAIWDLLDLAASDEVLYLMPRVFRIK
jgi:protease-4